MANQLYDLGRQKFLKALINMESDTIKVALVSDSYTPNLSTHEFLTDLSTYRVGTDQTFGSKTTTAGVFDAADSTWTAVAAGTNVKYLVVFKYTGVDATSPLIACLDTITGLPFTTSGSDVAMVWDNGANKIFKL